MDGQEVVGRLNARALLTSTERSSLNFTGRPVRWLARPFARQLLNSASRISAKLSCPPAFSSARSHGSESPPRRLGRAATTPPFGRVVHEVLERPATRPHGGSRQRNPRPETIERQGRTPDEHHPSSAAPPADRIG